MSTGNESPGTQLFPAGTGPVKATPVVAFLAGDDGRLPPASVQDPAAITEPSRPPLFAAPVAPVPASLTVSTTSLLARRRRVQRLPTLLADRLRDRARTFFSRLRECRAEMSVESVHEVRVAARRLLSQCALMETLGEDADLARARVRLKKFLSSLSECRDVQVQQELYAAWCDRFPGLEPVLRHLRKRERRLARGTGRRVRRFKARKVKMWLVLVDRRCRCSEQDRTCQRRLSGRVLARARLAFEEVSRLVAAVEGDDAATVHRVRVAFKRFRYLVEALSPEWTGLPRRELRRLARFQRQMGRIQDLRVASMVLADASVDPVVSEQFARFLKCQQARAFTGFRFWAKRLHELWPPALC